MKTKYSRIAIMAVALLALCACQPSLEDTTLELVDPDQSAVQYTFDKQTVSIQFNCNRTWKATTAAEWMEIATDKGSAGEAQTLTINLKENPDYSYRTDEIILSAGKAQLVITLTQEPQFYYLVLEDFDSELLIVEDSLPSGWRTLDADGDGYIWRTFRDTTGAAYAASWSYYDALYKTLSPDNTMTTPLFEIPAEGFSIKWDAKGSNADYLGDKFQVWVGTIADDTLYFGKMLYEGVTTSSTELSHFEYNLDEFKGITICIAFRHYDSTDLSSVLITNVEVSNRH